MTRAPRRWRGHWRWLACVASALWLSGCALPRAAKAPMDFIQLPVSAAHRSDTLIVFLPGSQEVPKDIVEESLVAQVRAAGIRADVIVADAHMGYFRAGSFVQRLREDVMLPARAQGYAAVWLAGISLGGFGSLMYAQTHLDEVQGIIALAPYLAPRAVLREVSQAGGLARWQPSLPLAADDHGRALLLWLKGYADPAQARPPLYMGYGERDRLQPFEPVMAGILPPDRMLSAPGGHEWGPWRRMWADALDRVPLPRAAGSVGH